MNRRRQRVTLDGEDVDVLLTMIRGATVRGRLSFDDQAAKGALSPNAVTVVLVRVDSVPLIRRLRIRDDWTFEATDLAGTFKFVVTLPAGWGLQRVISRGTDVIDTGLEMAGSDVDGVDIRLTRRLTSVGGVVRDRRGAIVDDASVVVFATDARKWNPGTRFIRATRTDAQGRYSLHGLPAGSYHAVALDYVEPGEETNPTLLERLRKAAASLTLADSEAAFLDLRLSEP